MAGVYDKLLQKHYHPPQRLAPGTQIRQTSENQEPNKIVNQKPGDDATMRRSDDPTTRLPDETTKRLPDDATTRRKIKRESMNFYEDQMKYLRNYALQEKMKGKQLGVSEMIRDAIDSYIEKIEEKK